jgi:hypothetical protein
MFLFFLSNDTDIVIIQQRYQAHLTMTVVQARPITAITTGINDLETAAKRIVYHSLLLLVEDIRQLIKKKVEHSTKNILDDPDLTVSSHARTRLQAFKKWTKVANPLAWDSEETSGGNYALLSLILCDDPNSDNPTLKLSKRNVTYDGLSQLLITFSTKVNQKRPAPITKDGEFQYVLPIAYQMIVKLFPPGGSIISHWSPFLIDMMKIMRIHLLPWHKDTPNSVSRSGPVRFFCYFWMDRNRNQLPIYRKCQKTGPD